MLHGLRKAWSGERNEQFDINIKTIIVMARVYVNHEPENRNQINSDFFTIILIACLEK